MHFVGDDEADGERRSVLSLIVAPEMEFGIELGGGAETEADNFVWAGKAVKRCWCCCMMA